MVTASSSGPTKLPAGTPPSARIQRMGAGRKLFVFILIGLGIGTAVVLGLEGMEFYRMDLWERGDHPDLAELRSSGSIGLTYGIVGTALILVNLTYLLRRHVKAMRRMGSLRTWMEVHILTGLLGPLIILFHSTFMFKTQVAIAASIALAVLVVTGVIGRYIYAQVPRTVSGAEAGPKILTERANAAEASLVEHLGEDNPLLERVRKLAHAKSKVPRNKVACLVMLPLISARTSVLRFRLWALASPIAAHLRSRGQPPPKELLEEIADVVLIRQRLQALETFRELLRWWRGMHRTFAILMIAAATVHITVAMVLGYGPTTGGF